MKKRFASLVLALAMFATLMPASLAADTDHDSCEFVELTREQYIASKAGALGISFEAAETIVDENIKQTLASIPALLGAEYDGFHGEGGYTDEYGVNTAYGYLVYTRDVPNTIRKLKVRMSVYTVIISGPPGRYVSEIGTTKVQPGSNGEYTLDASCDARISPDKQAVYITADGNAEIKRSEAENLGFDAEVISFGESHGSNYYLRYPFTVGATYTV